MTSEFMARIEESRALDPVIERVAQTITPVLRRPRVDAVLSGAWLGHPAHPMLTDVVIGAWASATLLDAIGDGHERAAEALVWAGVASAVPTALTGAWDWSSEGSRVRRLGLVHATANSVALLLQLASLTARRSGRTRQGRLWSLAAIGITSAAGYLGGHLAYVLGSRVEAPTA